MKEQFEYRADLVTFIRDVKKLNGYCNIRIPNEEFLSQKYNWNDYTLQWIFSALPISELVLPFDVKYNKTNNTLEWGRNTCCKINNVNEASNLDIVLKVSTALDLAYDLQTLNPNVDFNILDPKFHEDYANKIYLNCKPTQLRLPKEFKCDEQGNLVYKSRWVVYTFNNDKVTEDLHFLDTPQYQKCMELAREYGLTLTKEKSIDYLNQPLVQNTSLNTSQNSIVGNSNCTIQTEDKPQELNAENNHNLFKQMKNYIKNKREKSKEDLSESDMLFLR